DLLLRDQIAMTDNHASTRLCRLFPGLAEGGGNVERLEVAGESARLMARAGRRQEECRRRQQRRGRERRGRSQRAPGGAPWMPRMMESRGAHGRIVHFLASNRTGSRPRHQRCATRRPINTGRDGEVNPNLTETLIIDWNDSKL